MAFEIVTIRTAGLVLRPLTITIDIAMDEAARAFEAKVKQPGLSQADLLKALRGAPPVTIHASASDGYSLAAGEDGGDLLLTGHVEKRSPALRASEQELPIAGRSKTGDIVDSSAEHDTGEFRDQDAKAIIGALTKPYGVSVESDLQLAPEPVKRIRPGESIHTFARRLSRKDGFAIGDTPEGNLRLAKAGTKRHAGSLTEGQNILDASAVHDDSKRFSSVKVRAQAPDGFGNDDLRIEAEAEDDTLNRKRVRIIVPPELIRKQDARERAKWHRDRATGEGLTCEVTVPGWRDETGTLWTPGWLVFTELPSLDVLQDMLIRKVSLRQSDEESAGTQAVLSLADPRSLGGKKGKANKGTDYTGKAGGEDD
jgi:prophage tail gpP-like protein